MTLLLRRVLSLKDWFALDRAAIKVDSFVPPIWAVRDLMLSERDKDGLSVFEVDGLNDAISIAAAIAVHEENFGAQKVLLSVDKELTASKGFSIRQTNGGLCNSLADCKHREIVVNNTNDLLGITKIFMLGELISFEKKEIKLEATKQAKENRVDYVDVVHTRPSHSSNHAGKNLLYTFIKEKSVSIIGS